MNKEQLWQYYCEKNPRFASSGAHFTADGLRKFFNTTFRQAEKHALDQLASAAVTDELLDPHSVDQPVTAPAYATGLTVGQLMQLLTQWCEADDAHDSEIWIRAEKNADALFSISLSTPDSTSDQAIVLSAQSADPAATETE